MKKIFFLVGNYYPISMANGICVEAIAEELIKQNYEVHVICQKIGRELKDEEINGVLVHRVLSSLYKRVELKRMTKSVGNRYLLRGISLLIKLIHLPFYPITSFFLINRYKKKLLYFCGTEQITVISCFNPIEAVIAGMKVKKRMINNLNIGYYLDSLSNEGKIGLLPQKLRDYLGFRWEKKLFSDSDAILLMESHCNHYLSSDYKKFQGKIEFVDIPLYKEIKMDVCNNSHKIVYAGMLNSERRNPDYACSLLSEVLPNYVLEFYGRGDCDSILDKYRIENGGNVINKGFVNRDEAKQVIDKAEILLSIGNKDSDMTPSKIFEYVATGKKIIHFAYDKRDACIPYLNMYPNGLIINMYEEKIENIYKCKIFFESKIILDYNEINNRFMKNSPQYTIDVIKKYIKN